MVISLYTILNYLEKKKLIKPKCKFIYICRYIIVIRGSKVISLLKQSKKKRIVHTITGNRNMYVYLFNKQKE